MSTDLGINVAQTPPAERTPVISHAEEGSTLEDASNLTAGTIDIHAAALENQYDEELVASRKKIIGDIEGFPIFYSWRTREECYKCGFHAPPQAGIYGNRERGTISIVLSDGYKDDQDRGDVIEYTGVGGKDNNTSNGKIVSDQAWSRTQNEGFMTSLRNGNPVRVIRTSKCPSKYAPPEGVRYDGLYRVNDCWTSIGVDGKAICRFLLHRLPNQPPIPVRGNKSFAIHRSKRNRS